MDHDRFSFRPITPSDKAAVLALCAKIWDGEDYLPNSFDAWVADTDGLFNGCFIADRLIGLGKVSFVAPGHAWLEGLRKDPDAGVSGVGKALCLESLSYLARVPGLESIRFSAYAHNQATIALNEAIGFRRIETFTVKSKRLSPAVDGSGGRPLVKGDAGAYTARAAKDREAALERFRSNGFLSRFRVESWKAYPLDAKPALWPGDTVIEALDPAGKVGGALAFSIDPLKRQVNLIALTATNHEAAAALLLAAEDASRDSGYGYLETVAPRCGNVIETLDACGYVSWETEDDFLLYEWPAERLGDLPFGDR